MSFDPGHRLGPYEIVSPLGAGGMGEVYRARDTRLGRDVAVKVLPDSLRTNADAYARFEREARAVAALSHPNIMAIHDFGEHDGTAYAVVELLDGETLRDALVPGPLPQRKAIDYARQAARGLGAAHDGGVVHRDLKPENLFVTRDGRVKILDFGLARSATEPATSVPDDTPTFTHLTGPGTVLGTINYMSPEQTRGEVAGPSSDIFSLGSVLYEMLTGDRPFERETAPETMTAILRDDPPEMPTDRVPPGVQRLVQRCLEKRPEERFQSAHDLAFALETSSGVSTGVHPIVGAPASKPRRLSWWPAAVALAVGLTLGAFLFGGLRTAPATPPVKTSPITFSGYDTDPAASPDGRTIVFASRRAGAPGLWVKQLQGGGEGSLTQGEDGFPRFSPDGSTVLFVRTESGLSSVYRIGLVGGEPRKLIDNAVEADWSPDGSQVVFVRTDGPNSTLAVVNADGSGERVLADMPGNVVGSPRWSPDGTTVAFKATLSNNNIVKFVKLVDVETGELRDLAPERPCLSGLAWSGDGRHLVFAWSEDLLAGLASSAAPMSMQDVRSGATRDLFWTRDTLLLQIGTRIDVAGPGRVVFSTINTAQSLREVTVDGDSSDGQRTLTSGSSVDRQPVYAPDGETILFSSNRGGNLDLWTINTRTGAVLQLTDDEARDWDPAYTADGRQILWSSDRGGNLEIWMANADGSGARQVSSDGVDAENPGASPDGDWIVYMTSNPDKAGMWKVRSDGSEATQLYAGPAFIPEFSPDGRYVTFNVTTGANINTMMIMDLETGETTRFGDVARSSSYVTSANGRARWFSDSRKIAFIAGDGEQIGVMVQDFVPGRDTTATRRKLAGFEPEWVVETFDISPDDERVVLSRVRPGGTVMLAENVPHVAPPHRD
jgi:Tol biopolymer transport system component